tara:strand:- start:11305 stop:12366 length:1062 start_codon:yes stop_codon:yes gene_type:complete
MAVYKIFPEKDTFILSQYPAQNTGLDEILDISNYNGININSSAAGDLPAVTRALIQFKTTDINNVVNNIITGSAFSTNLKLYLANAENAPLNYTLEANPVSGAWDMGTGRVSDDPKTQDGCSWGWRGESGSNAWSSSGGDFYTDKSGSSQTFLYTSDKDISMDVTNMVKLWNSSSIDNHGFIVKHSASIEFSSSFVETQYFSMDTHTIYPPELEFKWDDSSHATPITLVTSSDFIVSFTNLKSEFEDSGIYDFRLKVRDTYPTRTFQTSSVYLNTKALPTSSYWGLKDSKTDEMVVDFDTSYTKISADSGSNYFTVYMDGLEPERYYQLMVKTIVGDETLVIEDKDNYFKVVR